jgi:hypothetical protein
MATPRALSNGDSTSVQRRSVELALTALNQPVSWWGWHGYSQPQPLSLTQILRAGNISGEMAALLWIGLRQGASLVVASDPPSSGKTTTLSALLPFLPDNAHLYFTRGLGEHFNLPELSGTPIYIMVNEISDHLPVYSWGANVQRIFELMAEGYAMASTMHCDTTDEVVEQLRDDVGVDPSLIGHLTFVLPIEVKWEGGAVRRRSLELSLLQPAADGPKIVDLGGWSEEAGAYLSADEDAVAQFADRFGGNAASARKDIDDRTRLLTDLTSKGVSGDELEQAIAGYDSGGAR